VNVRASILDRLREADLVGRVLADALGLADPPRAGSAIRCVHPERHKNGDAHPSLVVWKNGEGAKCQACAFGGGLLDIAKEQLNLPDRAAAAAALAEKYLGEKGRAAKPGDPIGPPQAVYDYVDENGKLLFQVLRFRTMGAGGKPDKTFRQRRPDPRKPAKWIWNLKGVRRVLFRLLQVLAAVREGKTIHVVEGEKDVLALEAVGATATCNPGGAGKWRPEYTEMLRGAKAVVIVADKDEPGRRHALAVAQGLGPAVEEVRVVEAALGNDAADHLAASKGIGEFVDATGVERGKQVAARRSPPAIEVTPDMAAVIDAAERALRESPEIEIYQRMGSLVRVTRDGLPKTRGLRRPVRAPMISPLPDGHLRELASRSAYWFKSSEHGDYHVLPPVWAVRALAERGRWAFPYLEAVIEAPALRSDGTILDRPGYDEASGLLYEPNAEYPRVPEDPTEAEVRQALAVLMEPFEEFCFVSKSDRAAALATIFTQIARHAIAGPTPLFAVVANAPGTGKGLLVQASTLITTGRLPTLMAPTHESEELRKVITTIAMEGHRAVLFDNAEGRFGSPVFAGALTATEWSGRILGYSRTVTAPLLAVWFVTGNNLAFVGDTHRRVVPVYLDAKVEHPEDREFRHPDLLAYVARERPRLHVAALVLLRAFFRAGCPAHGGPRMGSFEAWDDVVRSAVIRFLDVDPCAGRKRIREEDDADRELMRNLFGAWRSAYPNGAAATVPEAVQRAEQHPPLRRALAALYVRGDGAQLNSRAIGYALRRFRGRIFDGLRLERADTVQAGVLWRVVAVEPDPGRGDHGDQGDGSPHSDLGQEGEVGAPRHAPQEQEGGTDHRHHLDHLPDPGGEGTGGDADFDAEERRSIQEEGDPA